MLAKILLVIGVGLLFTHQFIAHHHHDEITASSQQHSDQDSDRGLPAHSIDHTFSTTHQAATDIAKIFPQEIVLYSWLSFRHLQPETPSTQGYHVIDIRPPVSGYFSSTLRRGPPAC